MHQPQVAAMAAAARPYVETDLETLELVRNIASVLICDGEATVEEVAEELMRHRMTHFGLRVGDVESASRVIGVAWRRSAAPVIEAGGAP
jgi:hypothetical protein